MRRSERERGGEVVATPKPNFREATPTLNSGIDCVMHTVGIQLRAEQLVLVLVARTHAQAKAHMHTHTHIHILAQTLSATNAVAAVVLICLFAVIIPCVPWT